MLKKLLLAGVSTGVVLLGLELTLRWFPAYNPSPHYLIGETPPPREDSLFMADPEIGWRLRPNRRSGEKGLEVSANAMGFRSLHDFDPAARPIVVVGDSFSFGTGVGDRETYPALLEAHLGESTVANLGIPGFGIHQVWMTVRHKALSLRPRLVIVGVVEADFERSQVRWDTGKRFQRPWFHLVDGRLVERTDADVPGPLVQALDRRGRIWSVGRMALQTLGRHFPVGEWWTLNAAFLTDVHAIGRAQGFPVLFVHLPQEDWRPFPTLRRHMATIEANFIDLTAETPVPPSGLFLPNDGHPSVSGHRFIAAAILQWIQSHVALVP